MTTPEFRWEDPFDLDAQLTEEERMVRDSIRAFCSDSLMPGIIEANRHERFDPDIMIRFGEMGCSAAPCRRNTAGRA